MRNKNSPKIIVQNFVAAMIAADFLVLKKLLSKNLVSYVTNAQGGLDFVNGSEDYLERLKAMDIPSVDFNMTINQLALINKEQVLVMIEVKAKKKRKKLHNHAAFLITVKRGKIESMWMVEALPAYSEEFWLS